MSRQTVLFFLMFALASLGRAQQQPSPYPNSPATISSAASQADPATPLLNQGLQLLEQKQLDGALAKVNAALQAAPQNADAYELRGTIYVKKKLWTQAEKDYQTALQLGGKTVPLKFNLAEIQFMQKKYDAARPGFVALERDLDIGDIAAYKVFLCDLFGGREDVAAREINTFNQAGRNASYYFANVAWSLYHKKTEDARDWLASAAGIYAPDKVRFYETSLIDLGYLPLPPAPQ